MPHRVVDSPLGPIRLDADSSGRLTALHLGASGAGAEPGTWRHPDTDRSDAVSGVLDDAAAQLDEYFDGARRSFDVPMAMEGSSFQRQVWDHLLDIPFGTVVSYAQLAERLGRTGAARAVGHANARNPIPIIVPCHRVIGSTGRLTGYGGGLPAKQFLLDLESGATISRRGEPRGLGSL
jgi:methylated-DNA-[protein]-cysteine S-methyltransferase